MKILMVFFVEIEKFILQLIWNLTGTQIPQKNLNKKHRTKLNFLISKHNKATVIKTVWYWHKDKYIDQRKRKKSLEINSHRPGQMILIRVTMWFNEERAVFLKVFLRCWKNWISTHERMKLVNYFTLYATVN